MIAVIDCGLSSLKLSVVDERGRSVETVAESYPTSRSDGRAEQDPADWWRALVRATSRLKQREAIEAIVPTGHMHGLVLLGADDEPLLPCLTLHDRRGAGAMTLVDASRFYESTGQVLDPALPMTKLLWLETHERETLRRASAILAPKDYLRLLLTGERATDHTDAAGTGLYDIHTRTWSEELVELSGLPATALVSIIESASRSGILRDAAAGELGLIPGLPVVCGAGDDIELLGATGHQASSAVEHFGTTGSILGCTGAGSIDARHGVELYPTCDPATYAAGASTSNAGSVIDWVEVNLGLRLEDALLADSGRLTVVPSLFGERGMPDSATRGTVLGIDVDVDAAAIAHAFLVGVAFGIRELSDAVSTVVAPVERLVTSGGGAAPLEWVRLRATCYGNALTVLRDDPTALGSAALALAALYDSKPDDVARSFERNAVVVEPDAGRVAEMAERYESFRQVKAALRSMAGAPSDGSISLAGGLL